MASVGQTLAQAGPRPASTRSWQKVHFWAMPLDGDTAMTSKGQAGTQCWFPLHTWPSTRTKPSAFLEMAPVGQASRQGASGQCLQLSE